MQRFRSSANADARSVTAPKPSPGSARAPIFQDRVDNFTVDFFQIVERIAISVSTMDEIRGPGRRTSCGAAGSFWWRSSTALVNSARASFSHGINSDRGVARLIRTTHLLNLRCAPRGRVAASGTGAVDRTFGVRCASLCCEGPHSHLEASQKLTRKRVSKC